MPKHENLEAYILCNGERLEEYDVQTDGNVVTCWVESKLDKCFKVFVDNSYEDRHVESHLYLDGVSMDKRLVREKHKAEHKGMRVDDQNVRQFRFCALQLTDDDDYFNNGTCTEKLGTIELKTTFVIDTGKRRPLPPQNQSNVEFGRELVHESTKKFAFHRVGTSEETTKLQMDPMGWVVEPFDKINPGPFISFCFKYRPRAFLEARGLVKPTTLPPTPMPALPPPPPSQTSERKRRIETKKEDPEYKIEETVEETDERIQELEAELEQLRQTRKKRRIDVKKETKEDPDAAPAVKLVILDSGVIDLT